MAIALVTSTTMTPAGNGGTTAALTTTGATLLVVSVSWYRQSGGIAAVSDNKGNTWIGLTTQSNGRDATRLFYAATPTVGTGHTFTVSGTGIVPFCAVLAYSGVGAAPFAVESGGVHASGPAPRSAGLVTPTINGSLILSSWGSFTGVSNPTCAGFTLRGFTNYVASVTVAGAVAELVQATAAAINPTWSWTGSQSTVIAAAVFTPAAPTAVEGADTYVWGPL